MLIYYLLALLPAISAIATGSIAIYMWQQRSVTGAKPFIGCIVSICIWCFFSVLECLSIQATPRIVFGKLQYLGIPFFAPYWFIFTLQYTHHDARLSHQKMRWLMVVPLLSLLFAFTDPLHGLIWTSVKLGRTPAPQLMIQHGWWFSYVMMPYNYLLLLGGVGVLLNTYFASSQIYRQQILVLLSATIIPFFSSLLYLLADVHLNGLDLTPISFALSSVIMIRGLFRGRLFEISPISYRTVFLNTEDAVIFLDTRHHIVDLNPSAYRESQHRDVLGQPFAVGFPAYQHLLTTPLPVEITDTIELSHPSHPLFKEVKIRALQSPGYRPVGSVVIIRDVTVEHQKQVQLQQFAYFDSLTGLCNRRQLEITGKLALSSAGQGLWPVALLYVDLNDFKPINDTYGHHIGDIVLIHVAKCLKTCVRQGDIVVRLGGDEFVALLFQANQDAAHNTRERIAVRLQQTLDIEAHTLHITASIGIACHPHNGRSLPELLHWADQAMYQDKQVYRAQHSPFFVDHS
ncbi:histidine kinase N-terminal 7TM domain-containing protein [Acaryochloris sp. IP29b_bin.148]|uniref:histidine kinase N-terminal 7TM domain-containing protein n=1 Tax=Acaryochloris sp. IP29b_bin.148 TaxID=2969218 RepID=UPI0026321463|nr:histidine kinase N-terminal 7TM domain-containing protein [Acaryochloris sp. IP29b_bin.148]